ncbi:hypothetical protein AGMMS49959_00170 [Planctomycetales bacterium]|nr:hypothetical protein AGMMS49959_00170 [Planctomycetales bacterium]
MSKILLSLWWIFAWSAVAPANATADAPSPALTAAIADAVDYLTRNQLPNGEFIYRRHLDARQYPYKNNLLRHSGTVYALGMARDFYARRGEVAAAQKIAAAIRHANGYLRKFIAPVAGEKEILAVWTPRELLDELAPRGSPVVAQLGGSALGILALLAETGASDAAPDTAPENLATAQSLGRYLLSQQRADGSFIAKITAGSHREDSFVSLYYPGQALLALVELYRRDGDRRWLNAAIRGGKYLSLSRELSGDYPPDHWLLIAGERLLPVLPPVALWTRAEFFRQTRKICEVILRAQLVDYALAGEYGAMRIGGQTAPTATMAEGLLAAINYLPPADAALRARLQLAAARAVRFLLRAQIKTGAERGGVPHSSTADLLRAAPERRRAGEIRIDYVQHALSAFVRFAEME